MTVPTLASISPRNVNGSDPASKYYPALDGPVQAATSDRVPVGDDNANRSRCQAQARMPFTHGDTDLGGSTPLCLRVLLNDVK